MLNKDELYYDFSSKDWKKMTMLKRMQQNGDNQISSIHNISCISFPTEWLEWWKTNNGVTTSDKTQITIRTISVFKNFSQIIYETLTKPKNFIL